MFIPRADALDNLMGDALEETMASSDVASSRTLLHEGDPCALGFGISCRGAMANRDGFCVAAARAREGVVLVLEGVRLAARSL